MFSNIVVPMDLSTPHPASVGVAEAIADRCGAAIRLVTVSSPGLEHDDAEEALAKLTEYVAGDDVRAEVIESNDVAVAVLEAAGDDLVCLETHARGPISALVLGSVAAEVLRRTAHPVLLVGPNARPDPQLERMEICIDGPDAAAAVVPVAAEWAGRFRLWPRLVSVWVPGAPHRFRNPDAAAEALATAAHDLAERLHVDIDWELLRAPAAPAAIVDDAERHIASLVVVAVRPHRRRQRALGTVAVAVAHGTSASVLAVPLSGGLADGAAAPGAA
jgi:nucleotide-binding universal stress UspA family protein